jgi:hypothetical protein
MTHASDKYDNYRVTNYIPVNNTNSIWINPVVIGNDQDIAMGIVVPSTS